MSFKQNRNEKICLLCFHLNFSDEEEVHNAEGCDSFDCRCCVAAAATADDDDDEDDGRGGREGGIME